METKTDSKTGEMFTDGSKIANKWFSDYASVMTDIFNKQMKMVSGFYGNFFRMFTDGSNPAMQQAGRLPEWMQAGNPFLKAFYGNGNGNVNGHSAMNMNPASFFSGFTSFISQLTEANYRLLQTYNQTLDNTIVWNELRDKYESFMEGQYEAAKKVMDVYTDTYRKQATFANDLNRTFLDIATRQMDSMVKQSQDFWNEMGHAYTAGTETAVKKEEKTPKNFKSAGIVVS